MSLPSIFSPRQQTAATGTQDPAPSQAGAPVAQPPVATAVNPTAGTTGDGGQQTGAAEAVLSTAEEAGPLDLITGLRDPAAEAAARRDERVRIKAIVDSPEAKGREGLAQALAFGTDMSVEEVAVALAAAPLAAPRGQLREQMAREGVPQVGPGPTQASSEPTVESCAAELLALAQPSAVN